MTVVEVFPRHTFLSKCPLEETSCAKRRASGFFRKQNDCYEELSTFAERNNVTPEHILIGSGSSAPLQWLATKVSREGHILGPDLFWDTTSKMGTANSKFRIIKKTSGQICCFI